MVFTVTVMVAAVPFGDGFTVVGLIEQLVPLGAPLHDNVTGSVKPLCPATLIVTLPECPTATERELVERVALKSPMLSRADAERVATPFDSPTVKV